MLEPIPDLLWESRALAEATSGREREEAWAIYALACKFAHTARHMLGHPELVAIAAERATWASSLSGDPVLPAVAAWMRMWDMRTTEDYADSLALGVKAQGMIDDLYRAGDPSAIRAWGSIGLRSAVSAARAGKRGQADEWISAAAEAADRLAPPPVGLERDSLTFSTGNVMVHGVSVAIEVGEYDHALALAERGAPAVLAALPASRRGHHHMDLAKCRLWTGDRQAALAELEMTERTAPQLVQNHPVARATLRSLICAERRSLREALRRMSQRFHLS